MSVTVHPPGEITLPGQVPPLTSGMYFATKHVAISGAEFTSIQAAIDAVALLALSDTQKGLVEVWPGLYLEDIVIPEFVHVVGKDGEVFIIGGSTTVDNNMVDIGGAASLNNCTIIAAQANKRAAVRVLDGITTTLDIRYNRNVTILDGATFDLDIGIEYLATASAFQRIWFDECKITMFGGQNIHTTGASTGGLTVRDVELAGGDLLIDGAKVRFIGSDVFSGGVINNVNLGFIPIGSNYPIPTGTGSIDPRLTSTQIRAVGVDGAIQFIEGQTFADDDANFHWDNVNKALGLGTSTPNAKAILDLVSTTKGFLMPRLTTVQRDAIISPPAGLEIYNTDTTKIEGFDGTAWQAARQTTPIFWIATGALAIVLSIDGFRAAPIDLEIVKVFISRRLAGTGGSTIVDINKAASGASPTTLYTTQANRPAVTAAAGDNLAIEATLPDIVNIDAGEFVNIDIDQVETGSGGNAPQDLDIAVGVIPR